MRQAAREMKTLLEDGDAPSVGQENVGCVLVILLLFAITVE